MLSNIKHAIFQPCDDNMIIILHFVLKSPIQINKKLVEHVQFYQEVGYGAEDLHDQRKHSNRYDYDDEERFEEEAKNRMN